jgi:hypothetical protein
LIPALSAAFSTPFKAEGIRMQMLLIFLGLIVAQINTLQEKPIVHLEPRSGAIQAYFGGKQLELQHAPTIIYLPMTPPKSDSQGNPWSVDIKNIGPGAVTVVGTNQFSSRIAVGQKIQVFSNGTSYSLHQFLK